MSKIFQLEGGQYEHPNEYKLVSTIRGTLSYNPNSVLLLLREMLLRLVHIIPFKKMGF